MHLLTRYSQRDDGWFETSITFILIARLELDDEEQHLFDRYQLHNRIVYNSEEFIRHVEAADKYLDEAAKAPNEEWSDILYNSLAALWHNFAGKFELQLTLKNLLDGAHIETQDLEEILRIEQLITTSVQCVADYLEIAITFDAREELSEY